MTGVLAVVPEPEPGHRRVPLLDLARYDRRAALTGQERAALALVAEHRYRWPTDAATGLARLIAPIHDARRMP
jgi:hypothetical protein